MKYFYLLFISIVFFVSCKKSNESSPPIIYTEIIPNVLIGFDSNYTIQKYEIDLNHDSINDFQINADYVLYYSIQGYPILGQIFTIMGLDSNKVMGIYQTEYHTMLLNFHYPLEYFSNNWKMEFVFYSNSNDGTGVGYTTCQTGSSMYLGLLVQKANQRFLGWIKLDWDLSINVLKVKSFAIINYPTLSIYTGQLY